MFTKIYEKIKEFIKENYKGLIAIVVVFLLFMIELPYSIYTPGGAVDLNKRITVSDGYEAEGSFNMAYVSMVRGSIPFLLLSYIIPDWDIVSADEITIEGENMEEMLERERLYMQESMDAAIINAYQAAGADISITGTISEVSYIAEEADTNLKIGDEIVRVNDVEIHSLDDLRAIIEELDEDEQVQLDVVRDDEELECYAYTYNTDDGMKIGVSLLTTYEYTTNPEVSITSKASEAGSSGGLMMSLTIYNSLVPEDITGGKKIVGTGTIDIDGNVGEIGGVKYKLIGAVKNDADVFICPEENYEEALSVAEDKNYDIQIISVGTFLEAIEALEELNKEKDLKESRYQSLANSTAEMDFTKCRELVESYVSMKNPSRTLIKNLINNIVIYDNGDEKTVKVNFKFKALSYFATTIKD